MPHSSPGPACPAPGVLWCWSCHPACLHAEGLFFCMCLSAPCAEPGKTNTKQVLFFWSLHAACMRLVRQTLARKASLGIHKLSDIQRSGGRIMLPRASELCHLPRVRNRTESGASLAWTLFHTSLANTALDSVPSLGYRFLFAYMFWLRCYVSSLFVSPPLKLLQVNMTGRKC